MDTGVRNLVHGGGTQACGSQRLCLHPAKDESHRPETIFEAVFTSFSAPSHAALRQSFSPSTHLILLQEVPCAYAALTTQSRCTPVEPDPPPWVPHHRPSAFVRLADPELRFQVRRPSCPSLTSKTPVTTTKKPCSAPGFSLALSPPPAPRSSAVSTLSKQAGAAPGARTMLFLLLNLMFLS